MARVRSFEAPHKGLRHLISMFSYRLGIVNVEDQNQLQTLKELGHELFVLLNDHVHTENEVTLQELEMRVPGASAHDLADHERLDKIQHHLEVNISALSGQESPEAVHELYLAFSLFQSNYLAHIYEEETVTEKLLQENFTDEELTDHRMRIMQRIDPAIMEIWLKYIIPAQGIAESVGMLAGFRAHAPKEVFDKIMRNIRAVMDADRFVLLESELRNVV